MHKSYLIMVCFFWWLGHDTVVAFLIAFVTYRADKKAPTGKRNYSLNFFYLLNEFLSFCYINYIIDKEGVKEFRYLRSKITWDGRSQKEIKSRIVQAKTWGLIQNKNCYAPPQST